MTNQGYECRVVEYVNYENVHVEVDGKHRVTVSLSNLRKGRIKNPFHPSHSGVGYIGVGAHSGTINGRETREYQTWSGILGRCYAPSTQRARSAYAGCTVHDDWHCYQDFAEWMSAHPFSLPGYDIDKDILIPGNKMYSKETCLFVPQEINNLFINSGPSASGLPRGVVRHSGGRFRAQISESRKKVHIGIFSTPEESFLAYKKAKEAHVKAVAKKYKDRIDRTAFDALMGWEAMP